MKIGFEKVYLRPQQCQTGRPGARVDRLCWPGPRGLHVGAEEQVALSGAQRPTTPRATSQAGLPQGEQSPGWKGPLGG